MDGQTEFEIGISFTILFSNEKSYWYWAPKTNQDSRHLLIRNMLFFMERLFCCRYFLSRFGCQSCFVNKFSGWLKPVFKLGSSIKIINPPIVDVLVSDLFILTIKVSKRVHAHKVYAIYKIGWQQVLIIRVVKFDKTKKLVLFHDHG